MFQAVASFFAGYACRHQCVNPPCSARLNTPGRSFKLSVVVHSASLAAVDGPGLVHNQRPLVGLSVGERTKETELGDWSKEKGQWSFREVITLVVNVDDEMCLFVSSSTRYNLYVASISLTSQRKGEFCIPVAAVLPKLKMEDRDAEGMVYTTPVIGFDVVMGGRVTGRVFLSFETKTPPPTRKGVDADRCCGWNNEGKYRVEEENPDLSWLNMGESCNTSSAGNTWFSDNTGTYVPAGVRVARVS